MRFAVRNAASRLSNATYEYHAATETLAPCIHGCMAVLSGTSYLMKVRRHHVDKGSLSGSSSFHQEVFSFLICYLFFGAIG